MKIALLEVSHWHFPLYIEALLSKGNEIIGISDKNLAVRDRYSNYFACQAFAEWQDLLNSVIPDVVFAFGRHAEMPLIGHALVKRGIPFALEKPAGLSSKDVKQLRLAAENADVPVGVPLVQRFGPLQSLIDYLIEEEQAEFSSTSWRFNAGPPERYKTMGCEWMLAAETSGGGCLINLAPHFIDFSLRLMPSQVRIVFAYTDNLLHGENVEDTATIMLSGAHGGSALIQTGYNFPNHSEKREYSFTLLGKDHYVKTTADGGSVTRSGFGVENINMNLDSDPMYGSFTKSFLEDIRTRRMPTVGLKDLQRSMEIIDAAYQSAKIGQSVVIK